MSSERRGFLEALAAFSLWGLFPLYWPLMQPAGALEILAHRIVWSLVLVAVLVVARHRVTAFVEIWQTSSARWAMLAAAGFVSLNWFTYIWAVNNGHVVEAALGYYINPLVSVALGVVFFGDRLRRGQQVALALAVAAVLVMGVELGHPPWIGLVLAFSFGLYGLTKKSAGVGPVEGLTFETSVIAPVAVAYLVWLSSVGRAEGWSHGPWHVLLLMSSGLVTAVPLLLFAGAANKVSLSVVGMTQYITPTTQFLCGVLVFHEAMSPGRWAGFVLVWCAVLVLLADSWTSMRRGSTRTPTEAVEADSVLDPDCR